jgi:EAL domain-containing protein (putative c-di-GMP-specific phosphodiesterase class I)
VRTIVALAQNLGMDVVAEGVETEDQVTMLRKLDCENGQGYLFSTPLGARQIDHFISTCNLETQIGTTGPLPPIEPRDALVA